jgi:hypothetical protein
VKWSLANAAKALEPAPGRRRAVRSPDCVFFDVDQVAAHYGRAQWVDSRMLLASRLPISPGAFQVFAQGLMRSASAYSFARLEKCFARISITPYGAASWGKMGRRVLLPAVRFREIVIWSISAI